jgi:molybdopterin molybdotransferase
MARSFFQVLSVAEVHALALRLGALPEEQVALGQALGRTLACDVVAPADLPGFARATMDGYAVRARDTFGATETSPGYLTLAGTVPVGQPATIELAPGHSAAIATGAMLPAGADAVVQLEHTRQLDAVTVEVTRSAAPGANVLEPTDDAAAGQTLLQRGQRLRAQDLGLLAALGVATVSAVRRPTAGIISTGDEVVPVEQAPRPGQVRDVNAVTLAALVAEAGGAPCSLGLVRDDAAAIRSAALRSRAELDLTLLSGGSSVGARDLTAEVFLSLPGARRLVHGVSVAPGKPFLWVEAGGHQLLGLPGQVTSCVIAFHLFVEPMLERLLGRAPRSFTRFGRAEATLARNVAAAPGRETYVRVRLIEEQGGRLRAEPLFGKSGVLRTLVEGQGLVVIPLGAEGLRAGTTVTVLTFP